MHVSINQWRAAVYTAIQYTVSVSWERDYRATVPIRSNSNKTAGLKLVGEQKNLYRLKYALITDTLCFKGALWSF